MNRQKNRSAENKKHESSPNTSKWGWNHIDLFYVNLAWLIILLMGVSCWFHSYTDHVKLVGSFLGLGGIGVFSTWILDRRKKHLKVIFDANMQLKRSSLVLAVCTGLLLITALNYGGIATDSSLDTRDREIAIRSAGSKSATCRTILSLGQKNKFAVFTGFGGRDYEIDVDGLPAIEKHLKPLSRLHLRVPGDLRRQNVVLLRPSAQLSMSVKDSSSYILEVRLDDDDPIPRPYRGRTVWIGTRKNLDIPAALREKWRMEIKSIPDAPVSTLQGWLDPEVLEEIPELKKDVKRIKVSVRHLDSSEPFAWGADIVQQIDSEEKFPQVIHLKTNRE